MIFMYYLLFINIFGFFLMFIDKKRAIHKKWRISENNLFIVCFLGGSLGTLLGMLYFRHKTKHLKFKYGIPILLIIQCFFIVFINLKGII